MVATRTSRPRRRYFETTTKLAALFSRPFLTNMIVVVIGLIG